MKINFSRSQIISGFLAISIFLLVGYMNLSSVKANVKYDYAKRFGGAGTDFANSVHISSNNKIIVAGVVNGDVDFNGDGDKIDSGESAVGYGGNDAYINVFDSSNNYLWSKRFGGTGDDRVNGIFTTDNEILVTGFVTGDADFNSDGDKVDPSESAVGYGGFDAYLISFDFNGNYNWSKRFGGTLNDSANKLIVNSSNQIVVVGVVRGNADFNSDGDSDDLGESGTGYAESDSYIAVYDLAGNFAWAKRFGGNGLDGVYDLKIDNNGRIATTGYITGDVDFNGDGDKVDTGESAVGYSGTDSYIAVFDANGNHIFSKRFGGSGSDTGNAIAIGANNQIIISGYIAGDVDFNSDGDKSDAGESAFGYGSLDAFINVYDSSGNYIWSKRLGGSGNDLGNAVSVDNNNRIVSTGYVTGDADLNSDGDKLDSGESSVGYGGVDAFINVSDSSGNYLWSKRFGGISSDISVWVFIDENQKLYISGYINGDVDFNGDGDKLDAGESATGYGGFDAFYAIFSTDYLPPVLTLPASLVTNDSTPTITFSIDAPASCRLSLTNESYDNMADDVICSGAGTTSASCTTPDLGAEGNKTVYLTCIDEYNNKSNPVAYQITIDTTVQPARITDIGMISNVSDSNNLYYYFTSQTPIIKGTAEAYATVTFKSGSQIYTTIADANGKYEITLKNPSLTLGKNVLEYYVTDLAGNISTTRTLTLVIGEEYFPTWLLPENIPVSDLSLSDLNQQNEMQEEIKEEISNLPETGNTITKIQILNPDGTPLKNQQVTLDGVIYTTDANGYIYVKSLKAGKYTIEVKLDDKVLKQEFEITAKQLKDGTKVIFEENEKFNLLWLCTIPVIIVIILIFFALKKNYKKNQKD